MQLLYKSAKTRSRVGTSRPCQRPAVIGIRHAPSFFPVCCLCGYFFLPLSEAALRWIVIGSLEQRQLPRVRKLGREKRTTDDPFVNVLGGRCRVAPLAKGAFADP